MPWSLARPGAAPVPAGSVAREHRDALLDLLPRHHGPSGDLWARPGSDGGLILEGADEALDAGFDALHRRLHREGLILGWREEPFPLWPLDQPLRACVHGGSARPLARIERAAARFWGSLTLGAHCNGWVGDRHGRPTRLWIARRSWQKATDPGRLDNLVGGGVPDGQTPEQTLQREGWEEAGLSAQRMAAARPGSALLLMHAVREGLQRECLYSFDLRLQPDERPQNQDGEVESFTCLPVAEAIEAAAAGEMTVDAALVTLDFALRHGLLDAEAAGLSQRLRAQALLVD
jgi:8-oxo-dGTP pyrophosphatase MutT (NUDIX family)